MIGERWSTSSEIKQVLSPVNEQNGGAILFKDEENYYCHTGEGHFLAIGGSGVGKSRRLTIPQTAALIKAKKSLVIADPKGEIWDATRHLLANSHQVFCLNFRDMKRSDSYNPLSYIWELYHQGEAAEAQKMTSELVECLTAGDRSLDKFWKDNERNLLIGSIALLAEFAKKEQCTFQQLANMLTEDFDMLDTSGDSIDGDCHLKHALKALPMGTPARQTLSSYASLKALSTKTCILNSVLNNTAIFSATEDIAAMTSGSSLDIALLDVEKPFAIWLILPDESNALDKIAAVILSQLTWFLIKSAERYGGKLPIETGITIEELGNIGKALPSLPHLCTASRSRGCKLTLVLQSLSQLETIYKKSEADTIIGNCDVTLAFRSNNWETLEMLERQCGQRVLQSGEYTEVQPLITANQLASMETGQALVMLSGKTKFITKLQDYTEQPYFKDAPQKKQQDDHRQYKKAVASGDESPFSLRDIPNIIASRAITGKRLVSSYTHIFVRRNDDD